MHVHMYENMYKIYTLIILVSTASVRASCVYLLQSVFVTFSHTYIFSTAQPRQYDSRLLNGDAQSHSFEIYDVKWKKICFRRNIQATKVCRSFGYTGKHFQLYEYKGFITHKV